MAGVVSLLAAAITLYLDPVPGAERNGLVAVILLALGIGLIFTAETRRCAVNRVLGRDTHEA